MQVGSLVCVERQGLATINGVVIQNRLEQVDGANQYVPTQVRRTDIGVVVVIGTDDICTPIPAEKKSSDTVFYQEDHGKAGDGTNGPPLVVG